MASVALAIALPGIGSAAAFAIFGATASATAIAVTTAVIGLALSVGLAVGMRFLAGGAPVQKSPIGPPTVFRQSISDAFIIIGKRRAGGLLVFFHPRVDGKDHYRYFVIAVAGHRCNGATDYQLGDEVVTVDPVTHMVTSGKYANAAWLEFERGDGATLCDMHDTFVAECGGKWTDDHIGTDTAKLFAKFKLTDDVIQAGMPNLTEIVEGTDQILDPRDGLEKYTRNGPLAFYWWMALPREEGGFGAYDDEIPDDTFISAQANVADEVVHSEPRYSLDAFIVTGSTPSEIRDVMVVNMAGSYTYSGGKHLMRPGYWVPPSVTLSEDDLAGPIQVSPFMASDRAANEVSGTFVSPDDGWQATAFATKSVASDDVRQLSVDFAYTTSKYQAERMALIMLNRAMAEKTVVWPMNIMGLGVTALDTVQCDSTRYGLNNYAFQVGQWGLSADWGVVLSLREENEDIYADPDPVVVTPPPTIDVADPVLTTTELQKALRTTYPQFGGSAITASESGGVASITVPDFDLQYPGIAAVPVTGHTFNSLNTSHTYYPFIDVDSVGDDTPNFGITSDYATAINSDTHPNRIFLNQTVTTPAGGSGGTSSGDGYGGGYGGGGPGTVLP